MFSTLPDKRFSVAACTLPFAMIKAAFARFSGNPISHKILTFSAFLSTGAFFFLFLCLGGGGGGGGSGITGFSTIIEIVEKAGIENPIFDSKGRKESPNLNFIVAAGSMPSFSLTT